MPPCLEGATVEEAVEIVRTLAEAVSDIHNVFVVDHRFHLLGVLPLARLILARAGETVDAVMDRQVISVTVNTDQEEVAQLFRKYDLLSLPVTDPRGALLGRITVDDVVDVLEEEASEDFAKLSGLGQEEPIFDSPMRTIRRRLPWLGLNLVTTSLSASVIGLFQGTIETMAVAAALMTIVAAQGGNAGVQTLTVMVRGLALGQVTLVHARGILLKELAVACGNGMALGLAAGVSGYLLHRQRTPGRRAGAGAAGQLSGGRSGREPDSAHPALAARGSGRGLQRLRHGLHGSLRVLRVPRASCLWVSGISAGRGITSSPAAVYSVKDRMASSFVPQISKILCIRTSSKSARTGLVIPHNFKSPPVAFSCLSDDRNAPRPELSTKRSSARSKTTFPRGSSSGAISRLNSLALLASSCSPGRTTTVTSPIFSVVSSIGLSLVQAVLRFLTMEMQFLPRSSR